MRVIVTGGAAVQAAAGQAGLARGAYAAQVFLAAAQETTPQFIEQKAE